MTPEEMAEMLAEEVRSYVDSALTKALAPLDERIKAIPAPTQGETGKTGEAGKDGAAGSQGAPGERGGYGERGIDGRDGRDGKDGIASLDQLNALVAAEVEKRLEVEITKRIDAAIGALPLMLYKGVYQDGASYREGNTVTYAGSGWVCMKSDTPDKPGVSDAWTLAIKEGRRGKDADVTLAQVKQMIDEAVRRALRGAA